MGKEATCKEENRKAAHEVPVHEQHQKELSLIENEILNILIKNKLNYSDCEYLIHHLQRDIEYHCKLQA